MNLDKISKLCNMVDNTYRIIASYFDVDNNIVFMSSWLTKRHEKLYNEQAVSILEHCRKSRDIQISIDDISITWIAIPIIIGEILRGNILLGPFYTNHIFEEELIGFIKNTDISSEKKESLLNNLRLITHYSCEDYIRIVKMIYFHLYEIEYDERKFGIVGQPFTVESSEKIIGTIHFNEEGQTHGTYLFECCMLECIRTGNIGNLKKLLDKGISGKAGILSVGNELRQIKNLIIITISLATRAAIEGGLNCECAFSLSDLYIRQVESMNNVREVVDLSGRVLFEFASRVRELLKVNTFSYYVNLCCDYIQTNISSNLSVNKIAEYLKISQEHLSRVFKKETGMSIVEYIGKEKVKEGKFLLKYSDDPLVVISDKLSYSSQSHFSSAFKKEMGITPKQYRDKVKVVITYAKK